MDREARALAPCLASLKQTGAGCVSSVGFMLLLVPLFPAERRRLLSQDPAACGGPQQRRSLEAGSQLCVQGLAVLASSLAEDKVPHLLNSCICMGRVGKPNNPICPGWMPKETGLAYDLFAFE